MFVTGDGDARPGGLRCALHICSVYRAPCGLSLFLTLGDRTERRGCAQRMSERAGVRYDGEGSCVLCDDR